MNTTECSRKDLILFVNDWCMTHKTTIKELSVRLDVSESGLSNFVSQFNGVNQKIGDELAKFFKVEYVTTTTSATFKHIPTPEQTAARKKKQTKSSERKLGARRAIEEHEERVRLKAEFGYNF